MKIAICTIGSRGDIQPFLVLGDYLNQNGHEVIVSSAAMYESLAEDYNLTYQSFNGDYETIIDNKAIKKQIGRNPITMGRILKEKVYPIIENSLELFYELLIWADIVLYHPKTMIDGIGEEYQNKLIKAYVVPAFTPTKEFTNPILSFLPVPKFLNKASYWFVNLLMMSFNKPVKNFRKKKNLKQKKGVLQTPVLYGISPSLLAKPRDYPNDAHFSGFWMQNDRSAKLPDAVHAFLSDASKVLLITFGSMPYQSDIDINAFIKAVQNTADVKVLLVKGWGLKEQDIDESEMVMAIDYAPFDLLFSKIDFVLHHGGAGTTAIALNSGIPQMITPVLHPFGDQYFWGLQLQKKGVGVKPVPLKKMSLATIKKSIEDLMDDALKANAKTLQTTLQEENGLLRAKEVIENHYERIYRVSDSSRKRA